MIRISQLRGVVGVAVKPAVIHHDIGGNRVQKLFELQVIVITYPVKWAVPVIDLAEADHTFPVQGKGMDRQVVLQCIVQRLMEKGSVDVLLSFGKQARKRNGDQIFVLADFNSLRACRFF